MYMSRFRSTVPVLLYGFIVAVSLVGCAAGGVKTEPLEGNWSLATTAGNAGVGQSLSFAETGRASGHAGCNRYSATIETDNAGSLRFGPVMATKMACLDDSRMQAERAFLTLLESVRGYRYADGRLRLTDENGTVVAEFRRVEYAGR